MVKVSIDGMMCMHCVAHAKEALEQIGTDVSVSLEENLATLNTDASDEEIKQVIDDVGYEVTSIERN